jgi:hypothetical protein
MGITGYARHVLAQVGYGWLLKSFVAMFERCQHYRPRRWMVHTTLDAHTDHDDFVVTRLQYARLHVPGA